VSADTVILSRAVLATPIGDMVALDSGAGLCALEFRDPEKRLSRLHTRFRRWFPPYEIADADTPTISRTRTWLEAYFAGASTDAGDMPLDMRGAAFEKQVWLALRAIPAGQTTSYGAIARALGSAGASRAVGAANGANPIAIIVPCHRVIGASGNLTGYGGGLPTKQWLLEHEQRFAVKGQRRLFA
jgi:methylated-DNA-[protein]-cysteine S-methyltransferase